MTRNLKVLGLAITAVLAMSAIVGASGAQAAAPEFHCTSTTENCWMTSSSNDNVFNVAGGNVKCVENGGVPGAQFKSTIPKTGTSATVEATYGNAGAGCTAFGVKAVVNMEGCTYLFKQVAASSPATATVDVVCPAGKSITVTAATLPCTVTVGAQTGLTHVTFANEGAAEPTDVKATIAVEAAKGKGITYTKTGAGCPEGTGTKSDGKYTGTATLKGFNDNPTTKAMEGEVGLHVF